MRAVLLALLLAQAAPIPQALTDLNDGFRRAYSDAKKRMLAGADPIIVAGGTTAVLLLDGRRVEANVATPLYDALKTIAHIPLAIDVALTPGDGALDAERVKTLEKLRALIAPARASLPALRLDPLQLARQERLMADALAFLDDVLARGAFRRDRLDAFIRASVPAVMANVSEATRADLDTLHTQVSAWRREMSPAAWDRLHVIVVGPHMPRDGSVTMQYFSRLVHEPLEGRRIVFAEALWDEGRSMDLLATHLLDGTIGEAFFGEAMRMHRDLLADAGRAYLMQLLPE